MIIIPAIDLKDGKCVRLLQGRKEDVTVYSDNPVEVAFKWQSSGASLIHIVDLDGAFTGEQKNLQAIKEIVNSIHIPIQLGGGIRDIKRIEMLFNLGIDRLIIGTAAIENPDMVKEASKSFLGKILVGIDAKNGYVAVKGWVELTKVKAIDLAMQMQDYGAFGIIYTDISKDGMLIGPNIEATEELVNSIDIPVIASGGVSSLKDIEALNKIDKLWGVIT
ncbi:MAG: 1-(5-phosphoribosyl)-5-[(5-phosphoribosylamino)methylideneamino]imidazole-4-carboxamide isomerase, partial [Thermodesulfovibrionales bacterium]|nr:1-(5-phosphoribosyl)-5-[(5-phosphoribosylamino)methylideneamino]imidazole-4-carboxamide isomerase [Thermodesulfovibrionales bacterium]